MQLCGDAHLSNFGGFASPERDLIFDLNDFDETLPGPWEWDVKRLAASVAVAGRERGFDRQAATPDACADVAPVPRGDARLRRHAQRSRSGTRGSTLGTLAASCADQRRQAKRLEQGRRKARRKDSLRAVREAHRTRSTATPRIVGDPPLIVPSRSWCPTGEAHELEDGLLRLLDALPREAAGRAPRLLDRYRYATSLARWSGVGSVGTRAWIVLLLGRDDGDPLFLQVKEAARVGAGAVRRRRAEYATRAQRVVEGQRLMQAASDIFLGWIAADGLDGQTRDFYVRQLWDWKALG